MITIANVEVTDHDGAVMAEIAGRLRLTRSQVAGVLVRWALDTVDRHDSTFAVLPIKKADL